MMAQCKRLTKAVVWSRVLSAAFVVALTVLPGRVHAKTWDHVANIKAAAVHLAQLQQAKGASGTYDFISACYQTHELAEEFSAPFEGCLVQDYLHSKVTAAVYSKIPAEERSKMGAPSPEELVGAMLRRFGAAFARYKLKEADARKLIADIDKHGIPAFTKARFPAKAE